MASCPGNIPKFSHLHLFLPNSVEVRTNEADIAGMQNRNMFSMTMMKTGTMEYVGLFCIQGSSIEFERLSERGDPLPQWRPLLWGMFMFHRISSTFHENGIFLLTSGNRPLRKGFYSGWTFFPPSSLYQIGLSMSHQLFLVMFFKAGLDIQALKME